MCKLYSQGVGKYEVVDKIISKSDHDLSEEEISTAPNELIAHRDIHYLLQSE